MVLGATTVPASASRQDPRYPSGYMRWGPRLAYLRRAGRVRTQPHPSSSVPIVPLDQVTPHCVGQVDIDTTIAFAPESPVLQPVIDAQLTPIAEALAKCPTGTTIHAVGHSAAVPDPSWGGGSDLEEQRAQAVLTRLLELGAPAHTLGAATAGGQIVDNMPGGQYREDLAIRNRIVTLTITC